MESPTREDLSTIVNEDFKPVKEQESHFYEDADDKAYRRRKFSVGKSEIAIDIGMILSTYITKRQVLWNLLFLLINFSTITQKY